MPAVNLQPLYGAQAAAMDIVFGITTKALDAYQKLADLGLQTMREAVADNHETMRKAFAAKDAQELLALQVTLVEPAAEKGRIFLEKVQEIAAATRSDFRKVAEAQFEANKRNLQEVFEKLSENAPAGSEGALSAWQAAMASGTTLCESIQQSTRQALELAENQVASAAAAAANVAHKANAQSARVAGKR
ncbi:TIGR01841 family phasin [Cupriavidus sp. LEh25]|nr:TIGR01841 family phasin [Cupriavidus sp. LEh25]